ncbi:MAG: transglycosylase domain-containing protein [Clostridium sp.]|nr:MAG: transglycosylase domain-containing protein [Clostridium sp.]
MIKTWNRKIEEALLTLELETHYSKDEILEGYLNTIDFSAGNYGIKDASKYYFNKEPKDLTLAESTILVGIPRNPSYYNPINNYDAAKKRQKEVLESMVKKINI